MMRPVRAFVAVTGREWFEFLRARPDIDELNFWQPSGGRRFGAVGVGELLLFKLHAPANAIVGGGTFLWADSFPAWLAWEAFEEKNGATSFEQMRQRIQRYRRQPISATGVEEIGCIVVGEPFFFDAAEWIEQPADWSPNIVRGKTYSDATPEGRALLAEVVLRSEAITSVRKGAAATEILGPVFGEPGLARRRLGQGGFKLIVLDAYDRRCAVTGEKALPVLQAAHIKPVASGGLHQLLNGLLLRSDVHTLFDKGYVTITPDDRFRVSQRLRSDFDNGEHYFALEHSAVQMPGQPERRPSRDNLEWHNDMVFLG